MATTNANRIGVVDHFQFLRYLAHIANQEAFRHHGARNSCICTSAAIVHVLQYLGYEARPLRIRVTVFSDKSDYATVLGSDGDGTRCPAAGPGMWRGHLAVVAKSRYLIDATIDQANDSEGRTCIEPLVAEVSPAFLSGTEHLVLFQGNARLSYRALPGRGGFRHAPAFRKSRWMPLAQDILKKMMRHFIRSEFRDGAPPADEVIRVEATC
jgi:hypothetical protein